MESAAGSSTLCKAKLCRLGSIGLLTPSHLWVLCSLCLLEKPIWPWFCFLFFIFNTDFADNLKHNLCPREAEGAGCRISQGVGVPAAFFSRIASDIFIACVLSRQGPQGFDCACNCFTEIRPLITRSSTRQP